MSEERNYTISHEGDHTIVHAYGKTRAGLFTNATKALFKAVRPNLHPQEEDEKSQHSFALEESTAEALLARLMNEAILVTANKQEVCEDLKLSLITDTKAEGHFVGCRLIDMEHPVSAAIEDGLRVFKNEETGEWEATIRFIGDL